MPHFFLSNAISGVPISYEYSRGYVIVSVLVAILSAIIALKIADVARLSNKPQLRQLAIVSGSFALGGGIWSMHFIGMLAINFGLHIHYDPVITSASILPSIFASWVALNMLANERIDTAQLIMGGTLVGAGIGTMHYCGMMAMHTDAIILYDPWYFACSLLCALALTMFAIWIKFKLARQVALSEIQSTLIAGTLLGLATTATHYVGMAAARILVTDKTSVATFYHQDNTQLVVQIGLTTLALSLFVFIGNLLLRYRELNTQLIKSEARSRAIVERAVDGIISVDSQGRILAMNQAAERLFGWAFEELESEPVQQLFVDSFKTKHHSFANKEARDVLARRKNGTLVPIRLATGKIDLPEQSIYVGFVTDLSDRVKMENEIVARETHYRSLINTFPGVIFRCEAQAPWRPLFISEAMSQVSGWAPEIFIQRERSFVDLIATEDLPIFKKALRSAAKTKKSQVVEYRIVDRFGKTRWLMQSLRYSIDPESKIAWLDGTMIDITTSKKAA